MELVAVQATANLAERGDLLAAAVIDKNRTRGLEILDNSRVPGVTKPTLQVNQFNTVDFLVGGIAFFRGFDRVGVTGYGWMNPGEVVGTPSIRPPMPYPANGKLGNPICSLLIKNYPGHSALDADGFPNGKNVPARSLVVGDVIEVAPSMFSTREAMAARGGDDGGIRYYSGEWVYVVGTGLLPWYGVQPRLNSVPLPADTLTGGLGSVSYNYSDNGDQMFQQPQNHTGMQNMQRFVEGRRIIHTTMGWWWSCPSRRWHSMGRCLRSIPCVLRNRCWAVGCWKRLQRPMCWRGCAACRTRTA